MQYSVGIYTCELGDGVYLGIWQLKDLKDAMSSEEVVDSREVAKLMLAVAAEASDESLASVATTGKPDR